MESASARRGRLPLDSALAQKGLKLALELFSAVRAYDANLVALRSNVFATSLFLLRKQTKFYLVKSSTQSMTNCFPPRDVSWKGAKRYASVHPVIGRLWHDVSPHPGLQIVYGRAASPIDLNISHTGHLACDRIPWVSCVSVELHDISRWTSRRQ